MAAASPEGLGTLDWETSTMRWSALFLSLALSWAATAEELRFRRSEGGQDHRFVQQLQGQVHAVLRPESRLILAFPSQNSGVALWFSGASLSWLQEPAFVAEAQGQKLRFKLRVRGSLRVQEVLLDSIRTIRDREQLGPQGAERVRRGRGQREEYRRGNGWQSWTRSGYRLELRQRGEVLEGVVRIPWAPQGVYAREELIHSQALGWMRQLPEPQRRRCHESLEGLRFLVGPEKWMAGSWRFLTYFGRDTLLSLMLLQPVLTPKAYANGLESVLVRLSSDGQVAHEEDLGDWASYRHRVEEGRLSQQPLYDYKMIDDDFLLPIALARAPGFPRCDRARRNAEFVLAQVDGLQHSSQGLALRPGLSVGEWRDSQEGLGGGRYPGNVNLTLIPAALEALSDQAPRARAMAQAWRQRVAPAYRVELSNDQLRERLKTFLSQLPDQEAKFFLDREVEPQGPSLGQFLQGAAGLDQGLRFWALSLDARGRAVEVVNSDFSFELFLGRPEKSEVEAALRLLELNFPLGLMTEVGPLVANPAYSPQHFDSLGRRAYHGSVIWSWQSAMLTAGLVQQQQRFPQLAARIQRVLSRLDAAEARAGKLAHSELWGFAIEPGQGLVARAFHGGGENESNPVQLWSTVYPAILWRRQQP